LRLDRAPEAVTALQEYVGSHPDDINAKKALMAAYQAANMPDSVTSVAKQLEAAGETVARTEVVAKTPFNDAVAAFNEQHWADAAAAAQKVMADEPNNRDALYMLVASYYQLKDGPQLVRWGKQFTSLDPASESGLQMLGFGYNLTKDSKSAVATRLKLNALPVAISSPSMESTDSAATFTATATGRAATDMNGKAIAPHPVTMTVDFLNKDGATVTSADVAVPALKESETANVKAAATGAGIVAWRYQLK